MGSNKVIPNELKKRLRKTKGRWTEEFLEVLWAYRWMPQSSIKETPFSLTYGMNTMILVELGELRLQTQVFSLEHNNQSLATSLDLLYELRYKAQIWEEVSKRRATRKYNSKVVPRRFHLGDLVWQMRNEARQNEDEFSANWEEPFRIREVAGNRTYRIEHLSGKIVPQTWNAFHLKFYFIWMY